jgi:broad specificity phosphatase PhoE
MARLYVIQRGRTDWDDQDRMESLCGAPLGAQGLQQMQRLAGQLAGKDLERIYTSTCQGERESAQLLAKALGLKVRYEDALAGPDYGMWQGLTVQEIRHRQGKLYRQWQAAPTQVRPPGGETLGEARSRLCEALAKICRRHRRGAVMLVVGPIAAALLRAHLENVELDGLWGLVQPPGSWTSYDTDGRLDQRT